LAWTLLVGTGVILFASSFRGWGDPIVDLGRDLYVSSQILEGRVLYRDLLYNYGPLAPYLLAGWVAMLGDGLWVFAAFGILVGLATLCALYAIGARLGGPWLGFSAAFLFLVLSFFASSTWGCNFVLPYSFAATLGTAFSVWSFYFLLRYLYDGRVSGNCRRSFPRLVDPRSFEEGGSTHPRCWSRSGAALWRGLHRPRPR
jgi:hypothetical protein